MCRNLSETAARDLIDFVREAMKAQQRVGAGLFALPYDARALLRKHGLLTPADDPELAAVFMEDDVQAVFNERLEFVVPMRSASEEARKTQTAGREVRTGSPARMSYADRPAAPYAFRAGDRVEMLQDAVAARLAAGVEPAGDADGNGRVRHPRSARGRIWALGVTRQQ